MSCDCKDSKKKQFTILKGKENLLKLIQGISEKDEKDDEKSETLLEESEKTFSEKKELLEEDLLEQKRLEYILRKIEELRYRKDNDIKNNE